MNTYVICKQWQIEYADRYDDIQTVASNDPFAVAHDAAAAWKIVCDELAKTVVKDFEKFVIIVMLFADARQHKNVTLDAATLIRNLANGTNPMEGA